MPRRTNRAVTVATVAAFVALAALLPADSILGLATLFGFGWLISRVVRAFADLELREVARAPCPRCGGFFFEQEARTLQPQSAECAICGLALGTPFAAAVDTTVARYARGQNWQLVHPFVVEGTRRGVRAVIEERAYLTRVECELPAPSDEALDAIARELRERVPGAEVVVDGPKVRVDLVGAADARVLDETLDAVADGSMVRAEGAYR